MKLFVMDKSKSEKGLQYKRILPYFTEVKWDISVLPFVRNTIINIKVHVVPHLYGKNNLVFSYLYFLSSNVQVFAFTKKAFLIFMTKYIWTVGISSTHRWVRAIPGQTS